MTRSLKKGPYVDEKLLKKIEGKNPEKPGLIKTLGTSKSDMLQKWLALSSESITEGQHLDVLVSEEMVGHRIRVNFLPSKKFLRHGGKMQKELEAAKKDAEIRAAKAAKATSETAAPKK